MNNPWWYIFFNVIIWIICFIITRQYSKQYYISRVEKKWQSGLVLIVYLIILLGSMFIFHGGDNDRYSDMVKNYGDQFFLYESGRSGMEWIYIRIAELVGGNFVLWKFIVYGFGLLLAHFTCKRFKCNEMLFLYAFVLMVQQSYGATRVFIAVAVYLFGLSLFDKNKKLQSVLGIGVCACSIIFHSSMVLPVALLPLMLFKITKNRFFILLLALPVFVRLFNGLPDYLSTNDEFMDSMSGHKMNIYTSGNSQTGGGSSLLIVLYRTAGYLMIAAMLFYSIVADNKKILKTAGTVVARLSFFIAYFAVVLFFTELGNSGTLFYRYYELEYALLYAMFPVLFAHTSVYTKRSRHVVEYLAICFNTINLLLLVYYAFMGK